MKIIILGAGQVGGSLAEILIEEHHDIILVDKNEERLQYFSNRLDIQTIPGHCAFPDVLRSAGAKDADMIIAVTNSDEANMLACQVAYSLFHVPKKIARVRSSHYFVNKALFGKENLPIDVFINPEQLITNHIAQLLLHPGALQVLELGSGAVKIVNLKPAYGSTLIGKTIATLYDSVPIVEFRMIALLRHDEPVALEADTTIAVGDEVFLIAATEDIGILMTTFYPKKKRYKRIMIVGGGHIGSLLAETLQDEYYVKLIEPDHQRCESLAAQLTNVIVLCAEASDEELLMNENIENTDVLIAVTDDDETNIITCIHAKRLGVKQTITLIARAAYTNLIETGPINIVISPQLVSVGSILTHVRHGDVVQVHELRRGRAEAIEMIAHGDYKTSKIVGRRVSELAWPPHTTIGAIIRGHTVMMAQPDTMLESNDHVILLMADKKYIAQLEKIFQVSPGFF